MRIQLSCVVLFAVLANNNILRAQSFDSPLAQPYTGMTAYSQQQYDVCAVINNPAALAQLENISGAIYGERRFLLAEITRYAATFGLPSALGNFALNINYAGFKNYNENRIGVAYAKSLGKKVDLGIGFDYAARHIAGYGNISNINAEAGVMVHLTNELTAGIQLYDLFQLNKSPEIKPLSYKLGIGADLSNDFFVSAEMIKAGNTPANVLAGFQYRVVKKLFVRAGILSDRSLLFAGAGLKLANFRIDISASYHPQLGISPGILLLIDSKKGSEIR